LRRWRWSVREVVVAVVGVLVLLVLLALALLVLPLLVLLAPSWSEPTEVKRVIGHNKHKIVSRGNFCLKINFPGN
jgi:hypothetical protein